MGVKSIICATCACLAVVSINANAVILEERLGGLAYYDADANLTWLTNANANANGAMNWADANAWAAGLDVAGVTGWRLPDTLHPDKSCVSQAGIVSAGYNCTGSEMGNLFYNVLGNEAGALSKTGPFNIPSHWYWSATGCTPNANHAWVFYMDKGLQGSDTKTLKAYAWAVHSGDVSAVPEPLINFFQTLGQGLSNPAFWVGFLLVLTFAVSRFALSKDHTNVIDPPVGARSFTTRFRYYLSATAYVGCYEFFFVILVGIGSIPVLQDFLKEWIGSLEISGSDALIGTPAWAALVTTSLLPSTPGFRTLDISIRKFLHQFASIPLKARALATEILNELERISENNGAPSSYQASNEENERLLRQLIWLKKSIDILQDDSKNQKNSELYEDFFKRYSATFKQARSKAKKYIDALQQAPEASSLISEESKIISQQMARFLCCALLQIENTELDIRNTIRERLNLSGLKKLKFAFSFKQMFIGITVIMFLTIIAGTSMVALSTPDILSYKMVLFVFSWIPYAILMLTPPFMLAAGAQLYFMDQRQLSNKEPPWDDKLLAICLMFAGSFALGVLPPLAGMAIRDLIHGAAWAMQILPFGLTPAVLSVVFFILVTHNLLRSFRWNLLLDFFLFAIVAAFFTWFATKTAIHFGLNLQVASGVPEFCDSVALKAYPLTAALLVGTLGALQCAISRQH